MMRKLKKVLTGLNSENIKYGLVNIDNDVDIIIDRKEISSVIKILEKHGFKLMFNTKKNYKLINNRLFLIDVHLGLSYLDEEILSFDKLEKYIIEENGIKCFSEKGLAVVFLVQWYFKNFGIDKKFKKRIIDRHVNEIEEIESIKREYLKKKKFNIFDKLFIIGKTNFAYFFTILRQKYKIKRKIILIGVDGSGKTTICKKLLKHLKTKTPFKGYYYYFGWKPYLPMTKIISKSLGTKNIKIHRKLNVNEKEENLNVKLKQSLLFGYSFLEYLSRYIRFVLAKDYDIALIDRYFYDTYLQYKKASKNRIFLFLMKLFPKPNLTFLLKAPLKVLHKRKKDIPMHGMQSQLNKCSSLKDLLDNCVVIDTHKNDVEKTKDIILEELFKKMIQ